MQWTNYRIQLQKNFPITTHRMCFKRLWFIFIVFIFIFWLKVLSGRVVWRLRWGWEYTQCRYNNACQTQYYHHHIILFISKTHLVKSRSSIITPWMVGHYNTYDVIYWCYWLMSSRLIYIFYFFKTYPLSPHTIRYLLGTSNNWSQSLEILNHHWMLEWRWRGILMIIKTWIDTDNSSDPFWIYYGLFSNS